MFDLKNQTLTQGRQTLPIKSWQVFFQCPKGLCTTLEEAIDACEASDWDPNLVICPVCVALDEAGRYEIIMRSQ